MLAGAMTAAHTAALPTATRMDLNIAVTFLG